MKSFSKLWLPVIAYAILIFWISSFDTPLNAKLESTNLDKVVHFLEYAVFGFLLMRAISGSDARISGRTAIVIAFLIGSFYGLTDELHQSVIPGRFATVSDFIFDCMGSLAGAIIWRRKHGKDLTF